MAPCSVFMTLFVILVGFVLGVAYFYGAYRTAMTLHDQKSPMAVLIGSLIGRTIFVMFIFYIVADGYANRVLLLLISFLCGRIVFMNSIMKKLENKKRESYFVKILRRVKEFKNK